MQAALETLLYSLSNKQQAAFAALTCEKLLPQYQAFCQAADWGSPAVFVSGIELLYDVALYGFPQPQAAAVRAKLALATPALGEFSADATPYALDACSALEQALLFLEDKQEIHLSYCATAATDTVEMFVQEQLALDPDHRDSSKRIATHPLMQTELARQARVMEALLRIELLSPPEIRALRQVNGPDNLIELVPLA